MTEQLRTPEEVADLCKISVKTVLRAIHSGRLTASKLGTRGAYRVAPEDMQLWIRHSRVQPKSVPTVPAPLPLDSLPLNKGSVDGRLVLKERVRR